MNKFNEHILLVMRWLQNPDLVSQEELKRNHSAAYYAKYAHTAAAYYASDNPVNAASAAYNASAVSNDIAKYWLSVTKERLDKYFELTKEDRKAYENRAKHLNILGAKNE